MSHFRIGIIHFENKTTINIVITSLETNLFDNETNYYPSFYTIGKSETFFFHSFFSPDSRIILFLCRFTVFSFRCTISFVYISLRWKGSRGFNCYIIYFFPGWNVINKVYHLLVSNAGDVGEKRWTDIFFCLGDDGYLYIFSRAVACTLPPFLAYCIHFFVAFGFFLFFFYSPLYPSMANHAIRLCEKAKSRDGIWGIGSRVL